MMKLENINLNKKKTNLELHNMQYLPIFASIHKYE